MYLMEILFDFLFQSPHSSLSTIVPLITNLQSFLIAHIYPLDMIMSCYIYRTILTPIGHCAQGIFLFRTQYRRAYLYMQEKWNF